MAAFQAPYRDFPAPLDVSIITERLPSLVDDGVDLVCCPEAVIGELANESDGDDPGRVALGTDTPEFARVFEALADWPLTIVVGFTERASSGALYNSAAVFTAGQLSGIYRKTYPGHSKCAAGDDLPLFDAGDVTFGVLICNDAHYVEPARVLAARGAQLLVVPVHGGHRPDKEAQWRDRGTNVLVARAVENAVPLVAADVAGRQGARISHGTTTIIDSQGRILSAAVDLEPDVIVADVDINGRGPRGGIDGTLLGTANPAVTAAYLSLWPQE